MAAGRPGTSPGNAICEPVNQRAPTRSDRASTSEQVLESTRRAFVEEIKIIRGNGVPQVVQAIDLCPILGAGHPFYNGGISPYLDR